MRGALLSALFSPIFVWLLSPAVLAQTPAPSRRPPPPAKASPQVIGCTSLANLRRLLRDAKGDHTAALAVLADEHADHLGCSPVPRERVTALADHVALGGESYDCLALRDTGICHWTLTDAIALPEPPAASRRAPVPAAGPPRAAQDKPRR